MSEKEFEVCGIGNALVDVLAKAEDRFLIENAIEKGGMTLIDAGRAEVLYELMGPGIEMSGGSAANTIAGIAALGGRAAYVGKVSDDQLGDVFAHDIRASGVTFKTARYQDGITTGRCLIMVTPDAQRSMNTFLGASTQLSPLDIMPEQINAAKVIYMEGYLFDPPAAQEAFYKAAGIAHGSGCAVSLTLSDSFCVERYRKEFQHLVETEVDVLFANEAEIMSLYETTNFDDALQIVRQKCSVTALTRSEAGSVIVEGEDVHVIDADAVDAVVDTTGAGDQFAAGFLLGFARGKDLKTCGMLGSMAAAEVIGHFGARPEEDLKAAAKARGLL